MSGCIALIVAAGRGERVGGDLPKQYRTLAGRALLNRTAAVFCAHPAVAGVRVVINPAHRDLYDSAVAGLDLLDPVPGGATRQESCRLGLESLAGLAPDAVLIHDAARPFVDSAIIDRTLSALDNATGALVAIPVVDTLKRAADGPEPSSLVGETVTREGLWRAQTPQGFRYREILEAHRAAARADAPPLTDDAAVAERAGMDIALVMGGEENFKVTTEADLRRAERVLAGAAHETRTGMGFDVHTFGPGDHIMLCGVPIEHSHGLVGHSDADAGLHALTDAILGTIGAGDIGSHFPPSDPQWKGAASDIFLRHATDLVRRRGGALISVDLTIICEQPKIRPHHDRLVARVAEILNVDRDRVSIKATTTERLGFTGRREGLAAQAIASVKLPASHD